MLRPDEKYKFYESFQKASDAGYVVIGAGLPRTGTTTTRHALGVLLEGKCHHMTDVFMGDVEKGTNSTISTSEAYLGHMRTGSLSHLRTMLPESSSWPLPAQRPNHAT